MSDETGRGGSFQTGSSILDVMVDVNGGQVSAVIQVSFMFTVISLVDSVRIFPADFALEVLGCCIPITSE